MEFHWIACDRFELEVKLPRLHLERIGPVSFRLWKRRSNTELYDCSWAHDLQYERMEFIVAS